MAHHHQNMVKGKLKEKVKACKTKIYEILKEITLSKEAQDVLDKAVELKKIF